ncbi:TPA: Fic family protein [Clostridioides difficile]|nr:Fic family protein [Clostridioides difficile]
MEFTKKSKLKNMYVNMNVARMLSKINEYKGRQLLYKKQPKEILENLEKKSLVDCSESTYIGNQRDSSNFNLEKLISNEVTPRSREELSIVEYRDVVKTINSAYESIPISSQTILELHGYLYKFSSTRGGSYKSDNDFIEHNLKPSEFISTDSSVNKVEKAVEEICEAYNTLIEEDEIDILILISAFVLDFILIHPFKEGNIKMARVLILLLLNKNGYEVGRYISLGKIFDDSSYEYYSNLNYLKASIGSEKADMNAWIEYFLETILTAYEKLDDILNISDKKRQTKTSRIEKIINSTLGYFTKEDIRDLCPDIPEPTINRVFNNLRKQDKIEVVARGRSAKWKKKY